MAHFFEIIFLHHYMDITYDGNSKGEMRDEKF